MQDLLNKMGKFAEKAADKTGELVETGKLKAQVVAAKNEISTAKKQIGEYYYEKYSKGVELDEAVAEICKDIREKELLIDELEAKIELGK